MATSVLERSPAVTQSTPVTHHRTTEVDGVNIFYREAGPAQAPVVLLLHGFPTSSHMFRNLIPALADRYHVIAPDYPGYGQSDMPDRARFAYTFDRFGELVDGLLDRLGVKRYAMYVMDYGAPVGWRLALKHPERSTPSGSLSARSPGRRVHLLDTGHFALEDKADEMVPMIRDFLDRKVAPSEQRA